VSIVEVSSGVIEVGSGTQLLTLSGGGDQCEARLHTSAHDVVVGQWVRDRWRVGQGARDRWRGGQ
jgi:hypothetical protein